jgi:hypothetical protein
VRCDQYVLPAVPAPGDKAGCCINITRLADRFNMAAAYFVKDMRIYLVARSLMQSVTRR